MHDAINKLLRATALEEKEQQDRYRLDQQHTLKMLKAEGLVLHPINITGKSIGYAEYPELRFKVPYPAETQLFRDGAAIECFFPEEEPVKGLLLSMEGNSGELRLFAPDFPDWIEDHGTGIKLAPDTRTTEIMQDALRRIEADKRLNQLFLEIHGASPAPLLRANESFELPFIHNRNLNSSQRSAVSAIRGNTHILVVHGPPGTGKTTTLVEAIRQLAGTGKKVLVSAPSNTAVDNICHGMVAAGLSILRVGNTGKTDQALLAHTPEGRLRGSGHQREIKELRIRAEEFRRMALKYKRNFGKAEREQRKLLFQEVKSIRNAIRKLRAYEEAKLYAEAQVIAGTPVGLYDASLHSMHFDTLILDEAGQCLEPLAWIIFPLADKLVLAGDPFQLPPTVVSSAAENLGLGRSILESAMLHLPQVHLLDTQYRMRASIAGFSSAWFYENLLRTAVHLEDKGVHIHFIDTAGTGMEEMPGPGGSSLQNTGELDIVRKLMEGEGIDPIQAAFISPYSGQVAVAREQLPSVMRIRTIDSFQGQEAGTVIVSLVRSNTDGDIGFLKDYRRMNVAMTRAKEHLYLIGDSATISRDPFYQAMISYVEEKGQYRSAWEFGT
jgi:ATP-dependent RNA/DNA helicase IGHMBP2